MQPRAPAAVGRLVNREKSPYGRIGDSYQGNMDKLRMIISIVVVLLGIGLTLTGLAVQPHSNPETSVQIVVWGMIVGGIVLILCGVILALRRKKQ